MQIADLVGASVTVPASIVRAIVAAVGARGHDPGPLLDRLGIDPRSLADVRARIPGLATAALWDEAPKLVGDPTFGLNLGASCMEALGVGAYLLRTSATFGEGLERVWAFYRIFNDVHPLVIERDDPAVVTLALRANDSPLPAPRHAVEFAFAAFVTAARQATGQHLVPVAVELGHAPPESTAAHAALFGCPVKFRTDESRFRFPSSWLDLELITFDPHLCEILELEARAELERLPVNATLATRVAHVVRAMFDKVPREEPTLEVVAGRLRMSARTLQRSLKEEGTTFQQELDTLRRAFAERRLRDGAGVAEVAYALGFADQSAFHKAFVRWTGRTPGDFRRSG